MSCARNKDRPTMFKIVGTLLGDLGFHCYLIILSAGDE